MRCPLLFRISHDIWCRLQSSAKEEPISGKIGFILCLHLLICIVASSMQGYVEAAQIFERESGTSPGFNLSTITDRTDIRKAVQSGELESAIERVNDLNPEVWHAGLLASVSQNHNITVSWDNK